MKRRRRSPEEIRDAWGGTSIPHKSVRLLEIVKEINLTKASEPPGFEDRANAVYLPLIGPGNAVTSLPELTLKPHNYAQLVVDPERVDARFLAGFLNTPLGHAVRESARSGVIIPKITKTTLKAMELPLPDPDTLLRVLEADTRISNLTSELNEIRDRLWLRPHELSQVVKVLDRVNHEEGFERWLEALPFPLASILWAYHVSPDDRRRYEHLDHFFEALAEFIAVVLLSAFYSDPELFATERTKLSEILAQQGLSLERATFGTWMRITERLAKRLRVLLNGPVKERQTCHRLFKTTDSDVLAAMTSTKLIGILQQANSLRNEWRAHGGTMSDKEARRRRIVLEGHLSEVRKCFADTWEKYVLVIPRTLEFVQGYFRVRAHRAMGTRTPFPLVELRTYEPLEEGQLHLTAELGLGGLKLLPFVKILEAPRTEQNACYFYNRIEDGGVRFVSYHFEAEAEIVQTFEDTARVLRVLLSDEESLGGST